MHDPQVFSWHAAPWQRLGPLEALPHALLIVGSAGIGKRVFADRLAWRLLCSAPALEGACGRCKGCQLLRAQVHPDLFVASPAESKKEIVIDQVRDLVEFLVLRPHTAAHKVAVVAPADALNLHAANSLLKALEEPPAGSYLILLADRPETLLPTLRSRCVRLHLPPAGTEEGMAWLQPQRAEPEGLLRAALALARQAPLAALRLLDEGMGERIGAEMADLVSLARGASDPINVAARWKKAGGRQALGWLQSWIFEVLGRGAVPSSELQLTVQQIHLKELYRFADAVTQARRLISEPVDELLLLEDILICWIHLQRKTTYV